MSIELDSHDPTSVIWRREVSRVIDPEILRSPGFRRVFQNSLESLEIDYEKAIDIAGLVDWIEDDLPEGASVRVASDGSSCEVTVQGFAGSIRVERHTLHIAGRPGMSPDALVEQFLKFQTRFGGKKGLPRVKG